ncbi:uncharacterized protein LOC129592004 [Paramacrobiotus metropolitanus]|uniref:uncharacterized protein LOC129592004 n=1 Tax=Paramacrobiotus metropolitanus TaxID=2943436 RepID=UPI0024462071|nr:uncharacterized protein LOC129592004 [Paramacrobiotus metropolitanus]
MEKTVILFHFCVVIITVIGPKYVEAENCYVCSQILPQGDYTAPVDCRDMRNAERRQCGSGSSGCYTFRGFQKIGDRVLSDGVLRLCNDQNTRQMFNQQSSWFWPVQSQQQQSTSCSSISISKASTMGASVQLNGQLCSCSGDFCNTDTPVTGATGLTGTSGNYVYYSGSATVSPWKGLWLSAGLLIPIVLFRH